MPYKKKEQKIALILLLSFAALCLFVNPVSSETVKAPDFQSLYQGRNGLFNSGGAAHQALQGVSIQHVIGTDSTMLAPGPDFRQISDKPHRL